MSQDVSSDRRKNTEKERFVFMFASTRGEMTIHIPAYARKK
jgi:hypothetical protein